VLDEVQGRARVHVPVDDRLDAVRPRVRRRPPPEGVVGEPREPARASAPRPRRDQRVELRAPDLDAQRARLLEPLVAGRGEPEHRLAEPDDDARLTLLCALIRLAEQFERSRDGAIRRVSVAAGDGAVTLAAEADPARDPSVPIWAARRNADLLAEALERDVEIAP
jgi:hypothetical protein